MQHDYESLTLQDATRMAVLPSLGRSKLKVEAVAQRVGVATSTLYQYIDGQRSLPAELLVPLYHATDDDLPLQTLAHHCGHVAIPLKRQGADLCAQRALARVLREQADIPSAAADLLDPDCPGGEEELRRMRREIVELVSALAVLYDAFQAQVAEGRRKG